MCTVFLSHKATEDGGRVSESREIAKMVYEELSTRGIKTFFSEKSIYYSGRSDYKKEIDRALDEAKVLIVIATDPSHLTSGWIEYEYETFYEDILGGKKWTAYSVHTQKTLINLSCQELFHDFKTIL